MGSLFHAVEEHYIKILVDIQDLLQKTISSDSVIIQHLITQVKKGILDTELGRLNYCWRYFFYFGGFSQIIISKEEKPEDNMGNIICLQKLNHPSRIENRHFGIPFVIFILKYPTNYFSALPCLYMQQNNWLVGNFFFSLLFNSRRKLKHETIYMKVLISTSTWKLEALMGWNDLGWPQCHSCTSLLWERGRK